jgi:Bifunctional DNA primase/polymerase, N-terminal
VRGQGGYVVVPPSRTEDSYKWVDRSPPAEASWLIERLTESDEATLF